jgi:hypothetical protein
VDESSNRERTMHPSSNRERTMHPSSNRERTMHPSPLIKSCNRNPCQTPKETTPRMQRRSLKEKKENNKTRMELSLSPTLTTTPQRGRKQNTSHLQNPTRWQWTAMPHRWLRLRRCPP